MFKESVKKIKNLSNWEKPLKTFISFSLCIFLFHWMGFIGAEESLPQTITLEKAFYLGLEHSPLIQQELAQIQKTLADKKIAFADFFPQVQVGSSLSRNESIESISALGLDEMKYGASLSMLQNLFSFGRLKYSIQTAKYEVAAIYHQLDHAKQTLLFKIEQSFLDILLNQEKKKTAEESLSLASQLLDQANIQFKAGRRTELDVLKAQAELDQNKAQLVQINTQLIFSYSQLSLHLGLSPQTHFEPDFNLMSSPNERPLENAFNDALDNRSDLLLLENKIQSSIAQSKYLKAQGYPDIDLFFDWNYNQHDFISSSSFFNNDQESTMVGGIKFSFPLFTGFRSHYQSLAQDALTDNLQAQKNQLILQIKHEIYSIQQQIISVHEQIVAQKAFLNSSEKAYQKTELSYQQGLLTLTDVQLALINLMQAKVALSEAYYQLHTQWALLKKAQGYDPFIHLKETV